jgi:hypothetical protein
VRGGFFQLPSLIVQRREGFERIYFSPGKRRGGDLICSPTILLHTNFAFERINFNFLFDDIFNLYRLYDSREVAVLNGNDAMTYSAILAKIYDKNR